MALLKCIDCGNSVSDKANACPQCGCPIEATIDNNQVIADIKELTKEEMWQMAYELHCKMSANNITNAVRIYEEIISRYKETNEAQWAEEKLQMIYKTHPKLIDNSKKTESITSNSNNGDPFGINKRSNNKINCDKHKNKNRSNMTIKGIITFILIMVFLKACIIIEYVMIGENPP